MNATYFSILWWLWIISYILIYSIFKYETEWIWNIQIFKKGSLSGHSTPGVDSYSIWEVPRQVEQSRSLLDSTAPAVTTIGKIYRVTPATNFSNSLVPQFEWRYYGIKLMQTKGRKYKISRSLTYVNRSSVGTETEHKQPFQFKLFPTQFSTAPAPSPLLASSVTRCY